MASHTRSVFRASRMVFLGRISAAMAAEWVMPEQPMVSMRRLLDNAVLDVEAELAGTLLRGAPTNTVGVAGDVGDLLGLNPLALLGDGRRSVVCTLGNRAHALHFCRILHVFSSPNSLADAPCTDAIVAGHAG